jgi:hypothetical protein
MQEKFTKTTYHRRLSELFSGTDRRRLRLIGGFLYAATSSVKRVTKMKIKLVSVFIEAIQNFRHDFLYKVTKFKNHQRTYSKYCMI